MPIFFGWGKQTTWDVGPVMSKICDHCHNETLWPLIRRTTWFSLFFVPIIPYKTEWWLLCRTCSYGIKLDDAQVRKIQPVAEVNQQLAKGEITPEQHSARLAVLNGSVETPASADVIDVTPEVKEIAARQEVYCGECGNRVGADDKFCTDCGVAIKPLTITT